MADLKHSCSSTVVNQALGFRDPPACMRLANQHMENTLFSFCGHRLDTLEKRRRYDLVDLPHSVHGECEPDLTPKLLGRNQPLCCQCQKECFIRSWPISLSAGFKMGAVISLWTWKRNRVIIRHPVEFILGCDTLQLLPLCRAAPHFMF